MLQRCGLRLSEAVDVEDDDKIVEFVMTSEVQRFPDAALRGFTIANETVYSKTKYMIITMISLLYFLINECPMTHP